MEDDAETRGSRVREREKETREEICKGESEREGVIEDERR